MSQEWSKEDREFADAVAQALRASERLDAAVGARLAAARARALDAAGRPRPPPWAWTLSGAVAASLLVFALLPWRESATAPADIATVEALDVLTDEMDPEFYQNLELYQWMAESSHV